MRTYKLFAAAVIAACVALPPTSAQAQVSININLGPPHVVRLYEPVYYGPWRTSYTQWEPVNLYVVDGVYYERPSPRARVVMVYRRGNQYFLPPREAAWVNVDRRFDYKHRPEQWDYDHGKPHGNNGRGRGRGNRY